MYSLILHDSGAKRIGVIKEIRMLLRCSLKEAKELTEDLPKTIKIYRNQNSANSGMHLLNAKGALCRIEFITDNEIEEPKYNPDEGWNFE